MLSVVCASRHPLASRRSLIVGALVLTLLAGCRGAPRPVVAKPAIVTAVEWGSAPGRFEPDLRHTPERLTVHHAGVATKPGEDYREKMRRLQQWGQRDKGWPDVPYHFLIAPDGTVFEGRPLEIAGATNTEYDTWGHALVQLFGDFEREQPTEAQIDAAVDVLAWLSTSRDIDPASLRGHRDYAKTSCPGANLYRMLEDGSLLERVLERIRGAR